MKQKGEEIGEKQKIKAITSKCQKAKKGINLSDKRLENYKSNIKDKTDLD